MTLNKGMKVFFQISSFALFIVAVFGLISATDSAKTGKINKVVVDIEPLQNDIYLIKNDDLAKLLNKSYDLKLKNQIVEKLDLTKIEKIIEKNDFVRDAQVYIDARNNLRIMVLQKSPILRVMLSDNTTFFIDESGKNLPVSKQAVLRLPVLTGALPAFKNEMTKDKKNVYYKAFEVIKAIDKDPFMSAMTEQLLVDDNKDISIIPKLGNHKIILGDATDLENKFKKLAIFYKEGMPPEGWSLYKEINLKFKNQVVAKKVEGEPIKN